MTCLSNVMGVFSFVPCHYHFTISTLQETSENIRTKDKINNLFVSRTITLVREVQSTKNLIDSIGTEVMELLTLEQQRIDQCQTFIIQPCMVKEDRTLVYTVR